MACLEIFTVRNFIQVAEGYFIFFGNPALVSSLLSSSSQRYGSLTFVPKYVSVCSVFFVDRVRKLCHSDCSVHNKTLQAIKNSFIKNIFELRAIFTIFGLHNL